ncbi:MAG: hypothetical protein KME30_14635 [Iphinoe sp. HA4291-MV1]|nr:hypothetical protein [Iphinoe sp. HA4291-MV1]
MPGIIPSSVNGEKNEQVMAMSDRIGVIPFHEIADTNGNWEPRTGNKELGNRALPIAHCPFVSTLK